MLRLCFVFLVTAPGSAFALSCAFPERNYYIHCENDVCGKGYSVVETSAYSLCGKLQEVGDIEPWMLKVAENELVRTGIDKAPRIIRLRYMIYSRQSGWPRDEGEYREKFGGAPKFPVVRPMLSSVAIPASLTDLQNMRTRDESAALRSRWIDRGVMLFDWSTLISVLVLLAWSVRRYFRLVLAGEKVGRGAPLLVQLLVFAVSSYFIVATWYGPLFSFSALLVLPIWLFQMGLLAYMRPRKSGSEAPQANPSTSSR